MKSKIKAISLLAITASLMSTLLPSATYAMIKEQEGSNTIGSPDGNSVNENSENIDSNLTSSEENPIDLLVTAIGNGDLVAVKNLICKHENLVNCVNDLNYPMLHTSVLFGTPDVVKLLIDNGADLDVRDSEGHTALEVAKVNGLEEIEKIIASASLFQVIESNKLEQVSRLIGEYKFLINCIDNKNNSPLHNAIKVGNPDVVSFLIGNGANILAKDENGQTPLHLIAKHNNLDTSIILKLFGANERDFIKTYVNSVDNDGRTALHLSSLNNNIENVQILIQCGANVNALDKYGRTPLYYAYESQGKFLNTELHLAVMKNDIKSVKDLIASGANLNSINARGETPLHIATTYDYVNLVWLLLSSGDSGSEGANPNIQDNEGRTPLHISAMRNNFEITDLLTAYGAQINVLDFYGAKPLDYALVSTIKKQNKVPAITNSTPFKSNNASIPSSLVPNSNYTGLSNIGNSCYYNTAIQQLYNIKPFREALINTYISNFKDNEQNNSDSFLYKLSKLFYTMDQLRGSKQIISHKFMNEIIGMLVDRNLGDSIDVAFQTIFSLLEESGFKCLNEFRIIGAHNVFSVFSEERRSQFLPDENKIDVSSILDFMFSNEFESENPNSNQANHLLLNLNYFNQRMNANVPETYKNSGGETFELESLSVRIGNHFVAWVREPDGKWRRISDSFVSDSVYDFNDMLLRAQREGNIASLIYTKK